MNEDEIPFQYKGKPPEKFKKALFLAIKVIMKDIKKEVLENKGFIYFDYISAQDIRFQVACDNPETRMKMHIKLQGLLGKLGLN
jgi:hypothetical protein